MARYKDVATRVLFYNYLSGQFVGNYKNWVFAQHVKDWGLLASKSAYDFLERLMEMSLVSDVGGEFSQSWGTAYQWYFLDSEQSEGQRLEIPALTPAELSPASSRD